MKVLNGILVVVILALLGVLLLRGEGGPRATGDPNATSTPVAAGTKEILVYFLNAKLDPEVTCTKVFPVRRTIEDTPAVARQALEALLQGPLAEEESGGYGTALNQGVKIRSLVIENGTAAVDFTEELGRDVAGSCRVAAIRSQIEATLSQFPSVRNVVISVDGRTEEVLQP